MLYQNQILQESGNIEKALKHLHEFSSQIVDKLAVKETMGELCLKLGKYTSAVPIWEDLIKRNPENTLYYNKYLVAKQVTDSNEIVDIYKKFQVSTGRSISSGQVFSNKWGIKLRWQCSLVASVLIVMFDRKNFEKSGGKRFSVNVLFVDPS